MVIYIYIWGRKIRFRKWDCRILQNQDRNKSSWFYERFLFFKILLSVALSFSFSLFLFQTCVFTRANTHTHTHTYKYIWCILKAADSLVCLSYYGGVLVVLMVKAMDCGIVVCKFVLQSRYYVRFQAILLGKVWTPLSSQLWFKLYNYCSSRRIALALNNLQRLMCH